MEAITNRYRIPERNLADLTAILDALARKAGKLGSGAISVQVLTEEVETVRSIDAYGLEHITLYYPILVSGPAPRIHGWTFVATLEHAEAGTIVRAVPGLTGEGDLAGFRKAAPSCEHCNARRARLDTFLLRHERGTYKQVGRTCLRDFLGHEAPQAAARMMEALCHVDDLCRAAGGDGWLGTAHDAPLSMESFLALTAAIIRRIGYVPRSKADEWGKTPTAALLDQVIEENAKHGCGTDREACTWTDRRGRPCHWHSLGGHIGTIDVDHEEAGAALAWIRGIQPAANLSDYMYNLWIAAQEKGVKQRHYGILASLLPAYRRELDREKERLAKAAAFPDGNEWVGTEGQRLPCLTLTVQRTMALESSYGVTTLVTFADAEGRRYKWFCSGDDSGYTEGETVTVTGTVKAHSEYQGRRATVLTRVAPYTSPEQKKEQAAQNKRLKAAGYVKGHCRSCWQRTMIDRQGCCPNCQPVPTKVDERSVEA